MFSCVCALPAAIEETGRGCGTHARSDLHFTLRSPEFRSCSVASLCFCEPRRKRPVR